MRKGLRARLSVHILSVHVGCRFSLSLYIYNLCVVREMSCATRSLLDFLTSSFAAETYGWEGGLQNSFGGAEQPRMIELLVYIVGGQLVLRNNLPQEALAADSISSFKSLVHPIFLHPYVAHFVLPLCYYV